MAIKFTQYSLFFWMYYKLIHVITVLWWWRHNWEDSEGLWEGYEEERKWNELKEEEGKVTAVWERVTKVSLLLLLFPRSVVFHFTLTLLRFLVFSTPHLHLVLVHPSFISFCFLLSSTPSSFSLSFLTQCHTGSSSSPLSQSVFCSVLGGQYRGGTAWYSEPQATATWRAVACNIPI